MNYTKIIITNLAAFYKVNLFNAMNERIKILVIFTGQDANVRDDSFYKDNVSFDYIDLSGFNANQKFKTVRGILKKNNYEELIIGGWDSILYWQCAFFSPTRKNSVIVESSYHESKTTGLKASIKKVFLNNISKAYVSGSSQKEILVRLKFKGKIITTKGVGVFNYIPQPPYIEKDEVKSFIYIGRLSPEKNLASLIKVFNRLSDYTLNIIGYGPQEEYLKSIANNNVAFYGSVNNEELPALFSENEVFILPSTSEAWGLVVEEAFNNGLPVIVSNRVGCAKEIVKHNENGLIFKLEEDDDLYNSIKKITDKDLYNKMRYNISKMNFEDIAANHIDLFVN